MPEPEDHLPDVRAGEAASPEVRLNDQPGLEDIDRLRELLVRPERSALQELRLLYADLRRQIHNPEHLTRLLVPIIADVISRKVTESSGAVAKAVAPIIDKAILEKTLQDKEAIARSIVPFISTALQEKVKISAEEIAEALAPISTMSIARQHRLAPEKVAHDLAPIMGAAIKEQIQSEREAVVDAFYPIIGSTIAKYMSETLNQLVRSINEKVEDSLSFAGLVRKVRAKVQGISEAELLVKESLPCSVEAAFLIHKSSGLVIAQAQKSGPGAFDPDLLSGMLTAIRGFFNESMTRSGSPSELDQIEYGESKILLEAAGYCYLAAVVRGEPDVRVRRELRDALARAVQKSGDALAHFTGDASKVPGDIDGQLQVLVDRPAGRLSSPRPSAPYSLILGASLLLLLIAVPLFVYQYRNLVDRDIEAKAMSVFSSSPSLRANRFAIKAERRTLTISGVVPNDYLRSAAESIARKASPESDVVNSLIIDGPPPLPAVTVSQVDNITASVNTIPAVSIEAECHDGNLLLRGVVPDSSLVERIAQAFEKTPGLRSLTNVIQVRYEGTTLKIMFGLGSSGLTPRALEQLEGLKSYLLYHPEMRMRITGHADLSGTTAMNRRLAVARAAAVRNALTRSGIDPRRMEIAGDSEPPPGIDATLHPQLSRCVDFEPLPPSPVAHR